MLLDDRTQAAVRGLLLAEPERGSLLPETALRATGQLIGCDVFGVSEIDQAGYRLRELTFPSTDMGDPQVCDGPVRAGFCHDAEQRHGRREAPAYGFRDFLRFGFKTAHGTVVQVYFDRQRATFAERELAVLTMVEPALGRLVRACAGHAPTGSLSATERQVLTLVAQGASNREVAEELFVSVHTVRKHLENAYRKLGVTNRTAAALHVRAGS